MIFSHHWIDISGEYSYGQWCWDGGLQDYSVSPSPSPFPLDFGFWIWDLDLGLDLGLTIIFNQSMSNIFRNNLSLFNNQTILLLVWPLSLCKHISVMMKKNLQYTYSYQQSIMESAERSEGKIFFAIIWHFLEIKQRKKVGDFKIAKKLRSEKFYFHCLIPFFCTAPWSYLQTRMIRAPRRLSSLAVSRPRPEVPPVTITLFPARLKEIKGVQQD